MRYEIDGPNLAVMPDTPYLKQYKIDYVNMTRDTDSSMSTNATVSSAATTSGSGSSSAAGGNSSTIAIKSVSKNKFWDTLVQNIKDILRETDQDVLIGGTNCGGEQTNSQPQAGNQGNPTASTSPVELQPNQQNDCKNYKTVQKATVIANPETGIVTVRATSKQHEKIQKFIDQVMNSARRQVMIEATIAEVELSEHYQQGINWSLAPLGRAGFTLTQAVAGTLTAPAQSIVSLAYNNTNSANGSLTAAIKLLDTFGNVKVLSSPKLSVLNNQTAVLKVVDNSVYFTIKADTNQNQTTTTTTYTTTLNTVPVGFVMNVTPEISDSGEVILNVHPSVSRIIGTVPDPNPALAAAGVTSSIPVIRTREMESVLRIQNGNIAVMGGLMEDSLQNTDDTIPGLAKIPTLGQIFQNKDNQNTKRELVVFLRPVIIKDPSINGDFRQFRSSLPDQNFFKTQPKQDSSAR
jgi:MSHA biogenesis protein MshL